MGQYRWYATGLLIGFILISLAALAARWHVLSQRVPLAASSDQGVAHARPDQSQDKPRNTGNPPVNERAAAGLLNLNSATVEELDRLPGIGPVLAGRIVAYREEHGPYRAASELIAIEGIGKIKLAKIEELLFVEPTE